MGFVGRIKTYTLIFKSSWLGSWYDIDPKTFLAVDVPFPNKRPNVGPIPTLDALWSTSIPVLNNFYVDFTTISELSTNSISALHSHIQGKLSDPPQLIPEDYNPPRYNSKNNTHKNITNEVFNHNEKTKVRSFMSFI